MKSTASVHDDTRILGDALVRIVVLPRAFELVVPGVAHPEGEETVRQPFAPTELRELAEVELVHRDHHRGDGEAEEQDHLPEEGVAIAVLERVEEVAVPEVELDLHEDLQQRQHDDGRGEPAAPLLVQEEAAGEPEEGGNGPRLDWSGGGVGFAHAPPSVSVCRFRLK
jgi:hypothetical protein